MRSKSQGIFSRLTGVGWGGSISHIRMSPHGGPWRPEVVRQCSAVTPGTLFFASLVRPWRRHCLPSVRFLLLACLGRPFVSFSVSRLLPREPFWQYFTMVLAHSHFRPLLRPRSSRDPFWPLLAPLGLPLPSLGAFLGALFRQKWDGHLWVKRLF
jgi:uncharacterized membrane protein YfcA